MSTIVGIDLGTTYSVAAYMTPSLFAVVAVSPMILGGSAIRF
jgi:molecular chaperone DnaK (HSP70)